MNLSANRRGPRMTVRTIGLWVCALLLAGRLCAQDSPRPAHGEPAAPTEYPRAELLVETEQLALWLGKDEKAPIHPNLVLIDARTAEAFELTHLPFAQNVESDPLQAPDSPPYFMPGPDAIAKLAEACGIQANSRIVVYDAEGGRQAARVWFTFWAYGHDQVSILNGGYPKWRDEEGRVTRTLHKPAAGTWKPLDRPRGLLSREDLARYRPRPTAPGQPTITTLLDARSYAEYMGQDTRAKLGGHVPGAVNLPYDVLLNAVSPRQKDPNSKDQGYWVWKTPQEIHALLRAACIQKSEPLGAYCQSGVRSAHLVFSLQLMGYEVSNYYGGWREYGNRDDVTIEK